MEEAGLLVDVGLAEIIKDLAWFEDTFTAFCDEWAAGGGRDLLP